MPPAYDVKSDHFDALMRQVCPHARSQINARIDQIARDWRRDGVYPPKFVARPERRR